jgi:hypothetical protein
MTIKRFNWDDWDTVVTECDGTQEGDIYRTDNTYACSSEIPSGSIGTSGCPITPPVTSGLSGCQLYMPPRIQDINILESSTIQIFIYGDGIK